jgi:acyl-CoA synthetase (NDP forming)
VADLSRLLRPASVVIVGASPTPGALGNSVLRNLERHGLVQSDNANSSPG